MAPPPAPAQPTLDALSDTGISSGDRVTADSTPTLRGASAVADGTTILVFADGALIGQTTADSSGAWSFTPDAPLGEGTRSITAIAENAVGSSAASAALSVTIDTAAPQVLGSSFAYLTSLSVSFTFSEDVNASLGATDLVFQNTTNATGYASVIQSYLSDVVRFGFEAVSPLRGDYVATLGAIGVTDVAGNSLASAASVSFFHLPGDVNRSRSVDFADLLIVAQHYGQPGTYAKGDLNYSGVVDFGDLLMLAQNYGLALLSASSMAAQAAATPVLAAKKATRKPLASIV
jgi:hypothetical protein